MWQVKGYNIYMMSARNLPRGLGFRMPGQQLSAHKMVVSRLLPIVLAGLVVACQSTATGIGQFTPPYLRLRLCGGEAQVRWWSGSPEWTAMEGEISVDSSGQIVAGAAEGARLCLGDGSTLELAPGVTIEVQNPRVFPRLRVTSSDGSLLFEAQQPSYEFVVPAGSVTILDVPARLRIAVSGGTTHVLVEEGAVACSLEMRTLTLLACWEMYAVVGGEEPVEPVVIDYCAANATPGLPTLTPFPSPTRWEAEPTVTPTLSPTPSSTPSPTPTLTPTRQSIITRTPTPMPVTAPPATAPPATKPPATAPPPPPTDEPPPPPTDEPPPPPTEPPPTRPTVAP
jgi:hypothetical protein